MNELSEVDKIKVSTHAECARDSLRCVKVMIRSMGRCIQHNLRDPKHKAITELHNDISRIDEILKAFEKIEDSQDECERYCQEYVEYWHRVRNN